MEENKYIVKADNVPDPLSVNEIFSFFWRLKYKIILSAISVLLVGFIYIKFQTPVYKRMSQIMLVDEKSGSTNEMAILKDIAGFQQSNLVEDEVFILRSPTLMTKVVNELNLNYRYYAYSVPTNPGIFGFLPIEYYGDSPFELILDFDNLYSESTLPESISFKFRVIDESTIEIVDFTEYMSEGAEIDVTETLQPKTLTYGTPMVRNGYALKVIKKQGATMPAGEKYKATWEKPYSAGTAYSAELTATAGSGALGKLAKSVNIVTLSIQDSKRKRADDILNMITVKYMEEARAFRNKSVISTIEFIDKRLETISGELGSVESNIRNYQQSNTLVNIETQSQLTLSSDMDYEKQLTEIRLQLQILTMIKENLNSMPADEFEIIPSNIGLTDAGLNQVISDYNMLLAERNRLVANSSTNNPRVLNANLQLSDGRNSIVKSIENLVGIYGIRESEVKNALSRSKSRISYIPAQQFDLAQIERKQQIIEPLYLLLQQKREEAQISLYAISDNVRVIEASYGSKDPISPNVIKIYLLALILGCCLPPAFFYLKDVLRTTVQTKEDIKRKLNIPILATLPRCDNAMELVTPSSRDTKSESFRMLRSNLKFLNGKMIQVTSSISGEGKSFVAANLALSLSHMGAKVLLAGMDIRKPKLQSLFNDFKIKGDHSIVAYLIGESQHPSDSVSPVQNKYGIDVAFSGSVPPNPSELLSTSRVQELLDYYRTKYDYIVIDSAPMMPISDSILINKFVDLTIYVIKSEVTSLKMLDEIAKLLYERNIKSPNLILNSVDLKSDRLRYGYGYGSYGYGYGYGYGYHNTGKTEEEKG